MYASVAGQFLRMLLIINEKDLMSPGKPQDWLDWLRGARSFTDQNAAEIIFLYDVEKAEIRPGERSTWQGAAVPTRLTLAILFFVRNDFRPLPFCARALAALGCERMVRARRSIPNCF